MDHTNRLQSEYARPRLAILVNILAPYRLPVYRGLAERYDTLVLLSGHEDNRRWSQVSGPAEAALRIKRSWGFTLRRARKGTSGGTHDLTYVHFNPGYLFDLVRFRPAAVVATEMGARSILALLYSFVFRVPLWIWWGGTTHTERNRSRNKVLLRRHLFVRFAKRWISYGESSSAYLLKLGVPRNRVLQIQNCVDEEVYRRPVEPYPLQAPQPSALVVGQMIERKGIYPLLEAAKAAQDAGHRFSLVVVGDGPEAERFDSEVRRLDVRNVERIPYVSPERMPSIYEACSFLVFPTLEDVWGLVVNEALWSGLPVIASRYAGCAGELLPPSNIFDPLDSSSFTQTFARALRGEVAPADTSRLKTTAEVTKMIADDIAVRKGSK